jgi:putative GTP pyrophosphokinase
MARKTQSQAADQQQGKGIENDPWHSDPDLVRQVVERRPDYEHLVDEVVYILRKRLADAALQVSSVSGRAKTLKSFLEKVQRKSYDAPLEEVTDFAGVRVVCLYREDVARIEAIIRHEFDVMEKVDKDAEKETDQFGYGAVHFIVTLGKKSSGARYDDLKDLRCEIQVRTIMQDAWAIIQHHLIYKRESEVPRPLQRRLNSLAGLFETADDQFARIRQDRDEYLSAVRDSSSDEVMFLKTELNLDTVQKYLEWKLPKRPLEKFEGQLRTIFSALDRSKYPVLRNIDDAMNATEKVRREIPGHLPNLKETAPSGVIPAAVELAWALSIVDEAFRGRPRMPRAWLMAILECMKE